MNKTKGIVLATLSLGLMGGTISAAKPAQASTKIPSSLRHNWYMNLSSIKDPSFVKFTATSMDMGDKGFHMKYKIKDLQVTKKKSGWYQIGPKGITNSTYKTKKIKIGNTKRTVLLQNYLGRSHYADVFVNGTKVTLPLGDSEYFLG